MKKILTILSVFLITLAFSILPALALDPPKITLDRVEVASIQPFFVNPKIMVPSKDDPKKKVETVGKYGYTSTMNVAYLLKVENPNKEPLMLDELSFTITFDGFEVNTVTSYEDSWVCPGKANNLRVIATNEAFPTIVSLMVGADNVEQVKKMKTSAGVLVGKWFKTIADFSFPIKITNGNALFKDAKGNEIRAQFTGSFGKASAAPAVPAPKKK